MNRSAIEWTDVSPMTTARWDLALVGLGLLLVVVWRRRRRRRCARRTRVSAAWLTDQVYNRMGDRE